MFTRSTLIPLFAMVTLLVMTAGCGAPATSIPPATAAAPPAPPANESASTLPGDAAFVDKHLTAYIKGIGKNWGETRAFSGYVHVTRGDKVLYSRAFGYADRATKRLATANTNFRVGSVTKQFTAAAVLVFEAAGTLSLSDPIKKFIPDYPDIGANITVHQLLTHTSGLFSYTDDPSFMKMRMRAHTPRQLLETFWNRPLVFSPSTKWQYSNSNYVVLGLILESVSGKSYSEVMQQYVFTPSGLTRTVVGDAAGMNDRALGYEVHDKALRPAKAISMSVPYAAGAVRSTATDLIKWHRVLAGTSLLSTISKNKLYAPEKKDYAYGWFVKNKDGRTMISHGGGIDGFLTDYTRLIEEDLVVVVWNNYANSSPRNITTAAVKAARGGVPVAAVETAPTKADPKLVAKCIGTYSLTKKATADLTKLAPAAVKSVATITLTAQADGLFLKPVGVPGVAMVGSKSGDFLAGGGAIRLVCKPAAGSVSASTVRVKQGPLDLEYKRIP